MATVKPTPEKSDPFYDASDDFPFYDCVDSDKPERRSPASRSATLRRRRPSATGSNHEEDRSRPAATSGDGKDESSTTTTADGETFLDAADSESLFQAARRDSKHKFLDSVHSIVTEADGDPVGGLDGDWADSRDVAGGVGAPSSSLLITLVEFMIKAISFQLSLLIKMFTCPFWCLYTTVMFVMDPFSMMKRGRRYILRKLLHLSSLVLEYVSPLVYQKLKEHDTVWKLVWRFGWGLFLAVYVCSVLFGLLIAAALISGFVMRHLVKEPIRIEENLNFDYAKHRPVAYVSVVCRGDSNCGVEYKDLAQVSHSKQYRVIPPNHKLEATVALALPESEYNKNLGIFQIRIEFLSSNRETLASSSRPCMLPFKSEPIRLMLTMFKIVPLVAGYISESQIIKVKFHGLVEGNVPTSCLRVLIEQRAEFQPGGGIPEIYDAKLILESELPLLRRILWSWRRTVFVWTMMGVFTTELSFALICCRPVILPGTKRRNRPVENSAARNDT